MGNRASVEKLRNKRVSLRLRQAQQDDKQQLKLLLLGAGESGKSTIFKQMKLLYGQGYTAEERYKMRPFLIGNVIEGATDVFAAAELVGVPIRDERARKAGKVLEKLGDRRNFSDEVVDAILTLWRDEDYREVWRQRSHFQLQDTWHEFVLKLEQYPKWGGPEWTPTTEEILRCRVRTTGVVDELFTVKNIKLRMLDVGGQRNERRKWIHCFEGVTSVIFVASLSEYDQMLFEDSSKNRLLESLELFGEVCGYTWFAEAAIILFLNKTDLFEEKYVNQKIPINISGLFPTAPSGTPDLRKAHAWFEREFRARCPDPKRNIYTHFTCATDTQAIDAVMKASSQNILRLNLTSSGVIV